MRWMGSVGCIREMRNAYKIFVRKLEGKRPLGHLDVSGKTILKLI
jgi:hypothetical protein